MDTRERGVRSVPEALLRPPRLRPQLGLLLVQYRNDLFFVESAALYASALCGGELDQNLEEMQGHRSAYLPSCSTVHPAAVHMQLLQGLARPRFSGTAMLQNSRSS